MSVLGVVVLNLLFFLAGSAVLWGVRGFSTRSEWAALGGIAYVCGLAGVAVLGTFVPMAGGGLSAVTILALVAGVGAAGIVVGIVKRRPLPAAATASAPVDLVALAPLAVTVLLLGLFFRAARIQPMTSWDAWAFWTTKAKAIYFFGGIDPSIFRQTWPSYPLLVPVLDAMNFRFMGSADTTALGVQYWLLAVGFVWAAAGLLRRVAPPRITWLFLALVVSVPQLDDRLLSRTADWPLDLFFGLAACALLAWIVTSETWLLTVFGLASAAMLVTKREGQLLAVCLVVGGLLAAGVRNRRSWLGVVGVGALSSIPALVWHVWLTSRHWPGDAPPGGVVHATFAYIHYAPQGFNLVADLLFDYHLWLGVTPLALAAALACLRLPDARPAAFFLLTFVLLFLGWSWENWAFVGAGYPITSSPSLNPTSRTVASLVVLSVVAAPVLVGQLLPRRVSVEAITPDTTPA